MDKLALKVPKGKHTLTVVTGNQSWNQSVIAVAKKESLSIEQNTLIIIAVVISATIIGAILFIRKRQ